jgi:heat shock protein HtpX
LLDRLDDAEIESVLGHELTHIRNGDVRMMVVAVIIVGAISFFTELIFRLWFYNSLGFRGGRSDERRGGGGAGVAVLVAIALLVVAYLLSFLIRLALSRSREFLADAGSVELTKNPDAMISALRKIEGRGELPGATSSIMEMCIDNPREGFGELFDTHPSVESRITAIVKFAGGHDPGPLALPPADDTADDESTAESPWKSAEQQTNSQTAAENDTNEDHGPWSQPESEPAPAPGPWGPHRS